jgi:Zn-finger nucleic acid-binding protein
MEGREDIFPCPSCRTPVDDHRRNKSEEVEEATCPKCGRTFIMQGNPWGEVSPPIQTFEPKKYSNYYN